MPNSNKPILVVGATGRHGGTGASVVRALRAHDVPVRALTRTADSRVLPLRTIGTEIAIGDLHDRRSLLSALKGGRNRIFTYPIARGVIEAAANFASAGRSTGLKRIVVMSMAVSHPDSPSHLGRAQWVAEDLFESAGFSCLHLRIAAFFRKYRVVAPHRYFGGWRDSKFIWRHCRELDGRRGWREAWWPRPCCIPGVLATRPRSIRVAAKAILMQKLQIL